MENKAEQNCCGDCQHCREGEVNPQNLTERTWHCYALPPTASAVPTQQGIAVMTTRPVITQGDAACSLFRPS